MLDMLTDRCSTMCLLVNLALLGTAARHSSVPAQHELGCGQPLAAPPQVCSSGGMDWWKKTLHGEGMRPSGIFGLLGDLLFSCALLRSLANLL